MNDVQLQQQVSPVVARAGNIIVQNAEQYGTAADFLKMVKEAQKKVKEYFEPMKTNAHQAWKEICNKENRMLDPLGKAESEVKTKMLTYQRIEEEKRQAEQRRLQAIADEKARKERERLEKEAAKLKTPELREQRLAEAETVIAPVIQVQTETPKVAGISTRKIWKSEVVSKIDFVKAAATDPNILALLEIDVAKLNKIAQATKGQIQYPGVRFYEETIMAGRSDF